ncbi:MAG TPA: MaoC family dehydratase [Acidimicrobiia bacterium]|nr:MaoC family dehydratase [Acidimicrobiia bacterium]
MTSFATTDEVAGAVGSHLGYSDWLEITQERIDAFADATDDHQWIHVDPERARAGPFGTTIAHGYLTLSLAVRFVDEIFSVGGVRMGVNYGTNKVRFVSAVPVGSKLRAGGVLAAVDETPGGLQATIDLTFEVEGAEKPACVAQVLYRLYS